MLTDARRLRDGSTLNTDVCIIGAGAAGITTALELADSELGVIVVESGGRTGPDPATQALYRGASVGRPIRGHIEPQPLGLDVIRLRWLGGTTNHWAGYCRKLEPIDFEERPHLAVSGWPIEPSDLHEHWARAARWCRITDASDDATVWSRRIGLPPPLPPSSEQHTRAFQITPVMRFGDEYRHDLESVDNVQVMLWANAVNLATDDGRAVQTVQARTLTGVGITVRARAFVLACGGLENPRLLLASTDADPAGVGNRHDQVGRYFAEHLQVAAGFGVIDARPEDLAGYLGGQATITDGRWSGRSHGVKYTLALTSDHVRAARTLGMEAQLLTGPVPPISAPRGPPTPVRQRAGAGVGAGAIADLMALTSGRVPASSVYVQALAEQELNPDSRVSLAAATDALGMRRITLDWRYSASDRAAVISGLRTLAAELGAAGLGRLQVIPGGVAVGMPDHEPADLIDLFSADLDAVDYENFPIGVGFHHMCTTRMSADPRRGVVDADCRVYGVDNLWVAGSSVFATPGVATPTFTIVALAVRLADRLREVLA